MANPVGRHLHERIVTTYDEDGKVLQRRIVVVYDDGKSPLYGPSTRHGEPPPKKPKLREKKGAAIDDATQARGIEHRLRKEARRLLALRKQRRKQQQQQQPSEGTSNEEQ